MKNCEPRKREEDAKNAKKPFFPAFAFSRSFAPFAVCSCLLACAGAAPPPTPRGPLPCDALPMLGDAEPRAIAADDAGGVVVAGDFRGPLRIDRFSIQGEGIFVLRLEPDSRSRWLKAVGGAGFRAHAAALLQNGDVVVAGEAQGRCFAARLAAADGAQVWQTVTGGDGSSCNALSRDGAWLAGSFTGVLNADTASRGMTDVLVAQLTGAGEIRLVRTFGGKGRDLARAIAAAPNGGVLVAGQFGGEVDVSESSVDFGRGAVRSAGDFDGFVVALGPDGKTRWAATFGDNGDDDVAALALGADGAVFAAGHHQPAGEFRGLVPHDVGNFTAAVLRYSAAGRGDWVRIFEGRNSSASSLALDGEGRVWAAGDFSGALSLGASKLAAAGKQDGFAFALSPVKGEPLGGRTFGSPGVDRIAGIAAVPGGIALAGSTRGEMPICSKVVGTAGEATGFVAWLRDLVK